MHRPSIKRDAEAFTEMQRRFLSYYLGKERLPGKRLMHNAARAAMAAGYSERTSHSIGHELIRKPHIRAAMDLHLEERRLEIRAEYELRYQRGRRRR